MSVIELLLQLQLPVWVVVVLVILGTVLSQYYRHRLERRAQQQLAELTSRHEIEKLKMEKILELVQDRHRARIQALDEISYLLGEFSHAYSHIRDGDSTYVANLEEFYGKARQEARKCENVLGKDFTEAVHMHTEVGLAIEHARFTLTTNTLQALKKTDVPQAVLQILEQKIGQTVPVIEAERLLEGIDDEVLWSLKHGIFRNCNISNEYDYTKFFDTRKRINDLRQKLVETLPDIGMDETIA